MNNSADMGDWKGVAVFAELRGNKLADVSLELLARAIRLAKGREPVFAVVMGSSVQEAAETLVKYGAEKVYACDAPALAVFTPEIYVNALESFIEDVRPSAVLAGATDLGRSLAARTAARLKTGLTAGCTALEMKENGELAQIRPTFGGNVMARIVTPKTRPQICTVRAGVFPFPSPTENKTGEIIYMEIPAEKLRGGVELINISEKPKPEGITEAKIIIAVGKGVKSHDDLPIIQKLCDALDAEIACTRPLVENGWFGPERQIGISGSTVKPELIVCTGVSGSLQFTAGIKNARRIVAVNNDPNAPIFSIAHHCFCGDLYEVVPRLTKLLDAKQPVI